jgi:hypothetical protein
MFPKMREVAYSSNIDYFTLFQYPKLSGATRVTTELTNYVIECVQQKPEVSAPLILKPGIGHDSRPHSSTWDLVTTYIPKINLNIILPTLRSFLVVASQEVFPSIHVVIWYQKIDRLWQTEHTAWVKKQAQDVGIETSHDRPIRRWSSGNRN